MIFVHEQRNKWCVYARTCLFTLVLILGEPLRVSGTLIYTTE